MYLILIFLGECSLSSVNFSRGKSNLDETQIKNENKFTKLIMEKLDNNIALVAQGEINKLDVRGGQ